MSSPLALTAGEVAGRDKHGKKGVCDTGSAGPGALAAARAALVPAPGFGKFPFLNAFPASAGTIPAHSAKANTRRGSRSSLKPSLPQGRGLSSARRGDRSCREPRAPSGGGSGVSLPSHPSTQARSRPCPARGGGKGCTSPATSLGHCSQTFQRSARAERFQDRLRVPSSLETVGSRNIPLLPVPFPPAALSRPGERPCRLRRVAFPAQRRRAHPGRRYQRPTEHSEHRRPGGRRKVSGHGKWFGLPPPPPGTYCLQIKRGDPASPSPSPPEAFGLGPRADASPPAR